MASRQLSLLLVLVLVLDLPEMLMIGEGTRASKSQYRQRNHPYHLRLMAVREDMLQSLWANSAIDRKLLLSLLLLLLLLLGNEGKRLHKLHNPIAR